MEFSQEKYTIYLLYATKPFIHDMMGGAAINEINKMSALINVHDVYYNDLYINDCFDENHNYDAKKFEEKYQKALQENRPKIEFCVNTVLFVPSKRYDFVFYRPIMHDEIQRRLFAFLPEPKIWSHSYHEPVWENNIVGFQTETAASMASNNQLKHYDSDGTLGYGENMIAPVKPTFILYQSIREKVAHYEDLGLKRKYRSEFIIGIIGTIYDPTYPWSHLRIIASLREKYREKNIVLLVISHTIVKKLPKRPWIQIVRSSKSLMPSYLREVDVIIDTWKNEQIVYGGSNKLIDCIAYRIPVITPKTASHVELLGESYCLFHDFYPAKDYLEKSVEQDIQDKLEKIIQGEKVQDIKDYLQNLCNRFRPETVCEKYNVQFRAFKRRNILLLCPDLYLGGVVTYSFDILESLRNFSLYFAVENKERITHYYYEKMKTICREINYNDLVSSCAITFDTIICNSSPINIDSLALVQHLRKMTNQLIYITHLDVAHSNLFLEHHHSYFDKIVTVNNITIRKLQNHLGIDGGRFLSISPCVKVSFCRKPKKKINQIIGYFGRINDIKQPLFLIHCFERLHLLYPQWKLYIVGPNMASWNMRSIRQAITHSKHRSTLEKNIVIIDKNIESHEEKTMYYEMFDVLISTTTMEGFPYVMVESMAHGTPVFISNVGGHSECIDPGVNGELFMFQGLEQNELYGCEVYKRLIHQLYKDKEENIQEFLRVVTKYLEKHELLLEMSKKALYTIQYHYNDIIFKNKWVGLVNKKDITNVNGMES